MKPNHGSGRQPLVEYYYLKDSFDLGGSRPTNPPSRSFDSNYAEMRREASESFLREAVLFAVITVIVVLSFVLAGNALTDFFHALAATGNQRDLVTGL